MKDPLAVFCDHVVHIHVHFQFVLVMMMLASCARLWAPSHCCSKLHSAVKKLETIWQRLVANSSSHLS